jgi:hypothetical protein
MDFGKKTYITDDSLGEIFGKLSSGISLEVILDCCHSGTGLRQANMRYIQAPFDYSFYADYDPDIKKRRITSQAHLEKKAATGKSFSFWSACRDGETSAETKIGEDIRGVFTYYFGKIVRKQNGQISRKQLKSLLSAAVKRSGHAQNLQLECPQKVIDKNIFS